MNADSHLRTNALAPDITFSIPFIHACVLDAHAGAKTNDKMLVFSNQATTDEYHLVRI